MKILLLILVLAATAANADFYKWTDNEGTVHFSDSPADAPAQYRKSGEPSGTDAMRPENNGPKPKDKNNRGESLQRGGNQATLPPQAEELKERMMNDEGIMTLIRALQDDPEMRALLSDPATMSAVQAGDIGTLMSNPAFLKILDNPRVREIEKKLNSGKQ